MVHIVRAIILGALFCCPLYSMVSSNSAQIGALFTKACYETGDQTELAAVHSIPYYIVCASAPNLRLAISGSEAILTNETDTNSIFSFTPNDASLLCSIVRHTGDIIGSGDKKNACFV